MGAQDDPQKTKRRILEEGAKLFFENQSRDPFQDLSLADVARRAGVTRNGLLYHWPTKEVFAADLAEYLLGLSDVFDEDFAAIGKAVRSSSGLPSFNALARVAAADLRSLKDSPVWVAMEALNLLYAPTQPELRAMAAEGYRDLDQQTWDSIYGAVCNRIGRTPRPPFTEAAVGAVLQAFVEGAGIRQLIDPNTLSEPRALAKDSRYSAYAIAAAAIIAALTRPADGSDDRDAVALVRDLLGEIAIGHAEMGENEACRCGSGRKFANCHGAA